MTAQRDGGEKFWERVNKCKHENLSPNYSVLVCCPTPYCSGEEVHCLDCGAYSTKCGCGYMNTISGWPYRRWEKHLWRKRKEGSA